MSTIFIGSDLSDAGRTGVHSSLADFSLAIAPATSSEFNVVRRPLKVIACWRMDDARFEFDSSFMRPGARTEIALLRQLLKGHPDSPISIFAHTDPTGDDVYNKKLSGRRARAIFALLTRAPEIWEELFSQPMMGDNWGTRSIQIALEALGFSPGPIDNQMGELTRNAVRLFQSSPRGAGLTVDGDPGPATREKLFRAYMDFLCQADDSGETLQLKKEDFLGKGIDVDGKADYQGCGEFNPVLVFSTEEDKEFHKPEAREQRNTENLPNRRVTIFVFAKAERVDVIQWPCPRWNEGPAGCEKRFFSNGQQRRNPQQSRRLYENTQDTFACRFYDRLANTSPCEGTGKLAVFRLRLCGPEQEPIKQAPLRIVQGSSSVPGTADDEGFITVVAKKTPDKVRIEWTTPDRSNEQIFPFAHEVFVAPPDDATDEGAEGALQRLHNVGYVHQVGLREKVLAFQLDFGRNPTGDFKDIKAELKQWHDGGAKPAVTKPAADGTEGG